MTNYTDLTTRIPAQLMGRNTDLTDNIEEIILEAQDELVNDLDHDAFRIFLSSRTITANTNSLDLTADDILEIRGLRATAENRRWGILPRNAEALHALYSDPDYRNMPRYYCEDDEPFKYLVYPTPEVDVTVVPSVNKAPTFISSGLETNIFTTRFPRLLEQVCFKRAAAFLKDYKAVQMYDGDYQKSIVEANRQIRRARRDEASQRPKPTNNVEGATN